MDALAQLQLLLSRTDALETARFTRCEKIDEVLRHLERTAKGVGSQRVPLDLQYEAVRAFWDSRRLKSLREARLVAFGICLPSAPGGPCVLDDGPRFAALLDGVDHWMAQPRRYRRCYQGLVANYFGYDRDAPQVPASGRDNWTKLRHYLRERSACIQEGTNPDWVTCVVENMGLFGEAPCDPYAADVLRGETGVIERLRTSLGIDDSSWFIRELILAQIAVASKGGDESFADLLPHLLGLLTPNAVLRDRGMILLLNRYVQSTPALMQRELRDCAVDWWGNPWMPSNSMRWGGVNSDAREMVAAWLKLEFIETFFTLLAEEGRGDRRRLEFWKRYVDAIDDIHFGLGSDALASVTRDFVELRAKMNGRTVALRDQVSSNNAFVMTIGDLVVVEFSGRANALYGYDRRQGLPFDLSKALVTTKDSRNSLKSSQRKLWLKHSDGHRGWDKWEQRFEEVLRKNFRIEPTTRDRPLLRSSVRSRSPEPGPLLRSTTGPESRKTGESFTPYSRADLKRVAAEHGCEIEDNTSRGGSLWVRTPQWSAAVDRVLSPWGFRFKAGKGWWK